MTVPEKFVNVTNGESALLQCTFVTTVQNTSGIIIQWSFVAKTSIMPQQVCRLMLLCPMLPHGHTPSASSMSPGPFYTPSAPKDIVLFMDKSAKGNVIVLTGIYKDV